MKMVKKFLVFNLLIFLLACGTLQDSSSEDRLLRASSTEKPAWTGNAGSVKSGHFTMFVGRASGIKNETEAISIATNDAFSKMSNYFGVSVKSDFISSEQETNGEYSYRIGLESKITGSQIKVKNYNIQGTYTEQWKRNFKEFDAFVLLAVPDNEIARIKVEVEGAGAWIVISDNEESVSGTKDFIQVLAKKRKIKFNQLPAKINPEDDVETNFEKLQTAFLLTVKCNSEKTEEYGGEYYTAINTVIELINLIDGKVVDRWNSEAKGGAFSKTDSIRKGVQESFRNIINQIQ